MPRAFTTFTTTLFDEENRDFCDLSAGATKMYMILSTQKEISACGSLPLTLRRWAKKIKESERHLMREWLQELADGRFILMDEDTEELLLRSFAKHDGGYKHGRRVLAVISSAEAISSPRLRDAIATELAKLDVFTAIPVPPESDHSQSEEPLETNHMATLVPLESGRDVVTYVSTSGNHIPETTSRVPGTGTRGKRLPPGWVPDPRLIAEMQTEGIPDDLARRELLKFRDHWASQPGAKGVKLDWDATWRNWLRRTYEQSHGSGRSGAADPFAAAELRAREAADHDTA